jgi:hypothetical protein
MTTRPEINPSMWQIARVISGGRCLLCSPLVPRREVIVNLWPTSNLYQFAPIVLCEEHHELAYDDWHNPTKRATLLGWCDSCGFGLSETMCSCGRPFQLLYSEFYQGDSPRLKVVAPAGKDPSAA